jgi:ATP synthase I chain.
VDAAGLQLASGSQKTLYSLSLPKAVCNSGFGASNKGLASMEKHTPIVLTDEERARIGQRASQGLINALVAQAGMALFAIVLCGLVSGTNAALSALVGAAAYFLPNSLFALRLLVGMFGPVRSGPVAFFWGEAFKLGTAIFILGFAALKGDDWLVWPALLLGLLCVLKGYVLLLAFRKLP